MIKCKVRWFNDSKGYGFLTSSETGKDVFVHYSVIEGDNKFKSLNENEEVDAEIYESDRGYQAKKVVRS